MGKPKFRSPIKALHQALFNSRRPGTKTMTWVCIQQAKTDSFRDACNSFQSTYYTASSSSSTSSDLCSTRKEELDQSPDTHMPSSIKQPTLEESLSFTSTDSDDSHPVKGSISSKRFFFSPCTTKSLSSTDSDDSHLSELVVKGYISSKRFFFYPCTTNSIMEEESDSDAKTEMGYQEIGLSESTWLEREEEAGEGRECLVVEKGFCRDSVKMAMASMNPFMDFRVSMEEMVMAHGLREWPRLQELLQCYLRLNDKTVHKIIISAFSDLLVNLVTEETNENNGGCSSSSYIEEEICLSFPLSLQSKALLHE